MIIHQKILSLLDKHKKKLLLILPFFALLVGFNGYLNPQQLRVFGDTYPKVYFQNIDRFQFYYRDFSESLSPSYYAPFRLFLDSNIFYFEKIFNVNVTEWFFVFFPFLISGLLSYCFFYALSEKKYWGFLVWFFYTFSTFYLFTSSIHTNIITSTNLCLFFLFLFYKYLYSEQGIRNTIIYVVYGSLTLLSVFAFELRMAIVTGPFFAVAFLLICALYIHEQKDYKTVKFSFGEFWNSKYKRLAGGLLSTFAIVLIIALAYSYLLLNLGVVTEQVGKAITRGTWGSSYFSILNTIAISHPFWNNYSPVNFVYNFPSAIYYLNAILLLVLVFSLKDFKKFKQIVVLYLILFFYLTLSKQNNLPFKNLYEYLYKFPYFSFSREASKYYYGYLLSLCFGFLLYIRILKKRNWWIGFAVALCMLIPSLYNFYIFSSLKYANSTIQYGNDISVYEKINSIIAEESTTTVKRVLWLPYLPSLQNETDTVKHYSFPLLLYSMYPFDDIRKNSRSYKFEAVADKNFRDYVRLFGIQYIVIPNFENEQEITNQMYLSYKDFDEEEFTNYIISNFKLKSISEISGYILYKIEDSEPKLKIVDTALNPHYLDAGKIVFGASTHLDPRLSSKEINVASTLGNCNSNTAKGLDFNPADRVKISTTTGQNFDINIFAKYEEVPCIFFKVDTKKSNSNFILDVSKYAGSDTEFVTYDGNLGSKINKIYTLNERSVGFLNVSCTNNPCYVSMYEYGDNLINNATTTMSLRFYSNLENASTTSNESISILEYEVKTLIGQKMIIKNSSDYILLRYPFSANYAISFNNKKYYPLKNNHNLLIFRNPLKDAEVGTKEVEAQIVFEPEIRIHRSLQFSMLVYYIILILSVFTIPILIYDLKK